jgi:hypothetical protein
MTVLWRVEHVIAAGEIEAVHPDDLRKVWEIWPHLQEQKAGGLTLKDVQQTLTPDADIHIVIAYCSVLKHYIEQGRLNAAAIDFVEAAKAIPLLVC